MNNLVSQEFLTLQTYAKTLDWTTGSTAEATYAAMGQFVNGLSNPQQYVTSYYKLSSTLYGKLVTLFADKENVGPLSNPNIPDDTTQPDDVVSCFRDYCLSLDASNIIALLTDTKKELNQNRDLYFNQAGGLKQLEGFISFGIPEHYDDVV